MANEKESLCELRLPGEMDVDTYKDFCLSNIELQRQIAISKKSNPGVNPGVDKLLSTLS